MMVKVSDSGRVSRVHRIQLGLERWREFQGQVKQRGIPVVMNKSQVWKQYCDNAPRDEEHGLLLGSDELSMIRIKHFVFSIRNCSTIDS